MIIEVSVAYLRGDRSNLRWFIEYTENGILKDTVIKGAWDKFDAEDMFKREHALSNSIRIIGIFCMD